MSISANILCDFKLGASRSGKLSGFTGDAAITDVSVAPGSFSTDEDGPSGYIVFVPSLKASLTVDKKVVNDNGGDVVVTFSINAQNTGLDTATNVLVTDAVLPDFRQVSASITGVNRMAETSPAGTGLDLGIETLAHGCNCHPDVSGNCGCAIRRARTASKQS